MKKLSSPKKSSNKMNSPKKDALKQLKVANMKPNYDGAKTKPISSHLFKEISKMTKNLKEQSLKSLDLTKQQIISSDPIASKRIESLKSTKLSSLSSQKSIKKKRIPKVRLKRFKKDPKFLEQCDLKDEKKKCRICFSVKSDRKTGDLIIPCNCRGIFATVHQKCISDWIVSMCSDTCDICRFKFSIKARNKGLIDFIIEERQYHFIWRTITIILFSIYLIILVAAFIQVSEKYSFMNDSFTIVYKASCSILIFILLCYVGYYFIERFLTFKEWRKYKYHITVKPNSNYKINEITTPPPDIMRSSGLRDYSIKPLIRSVL